MKSTIWMETLTALVRAVVLVVVGWLVSHSIITAEQSEHFTSELTVSIVSALALFLVTFGASVWQKVKAKFLLRLALDAPSGTTVEEVKAAAATVPAREKMAAVMEGEKR